jgi:8-oxo-dGTP pyrophosphatase MutT (NUDIX family)
MKNNAKIARALAPVKRRHFDRFASEELRARLATDWSGLPVLGSEVASVRPLVQSGVLAFRRLDDGDIVVLLVKKPNSKNWGIPKGNAEPDLTLAENAAKEAYEEAGVKGHIAPRSAGTYRAVKRMSGMKLVVEVSVYLLEVFETAKKWPEMDEREIIWCSPREAAILLREPLLVELCGRLIGRGAA